MGLNNTPSANRIHIGFFGKRNSGKSSLVNAVTGQDLAVVSDVKGTTTDPVYKSMELLPLGPVMIIDTPGIDDEGALGELRVRKTRQVLNKTDVAVMVIDSVSGKTKEDEELIALFDEKKINYIIAYNKADLLAEKQPETENAIFVSAKTGYNIERLKEKNSINEIINILVLIPFTEAVKGSIFDNKTAAINPQSDIIIIIRLSTVLNFIMLL